MLFLIFLIWFIPLVWGMVWITKKVYSSFTKPWLKITMGSITALVFIGVLWGDSIAGHIYLNHLCKTQGGPHIYQTVELGPEYWNEDGSAKFIYPVEIRKSVMNEKILKHEYSGKSFNVKNKYKFNITKYGNKILNKKGDVLSEEIFFTKTSGWLAHSIGYQPGGSGCEISSNYRQLIINTFKKR